MNVQNMEELITVIENTKHQPNIRMFEAGQFNMADYVLEDDNGCNTPACIAGHAHVLAGRSVDQMHLLTPKQHEQNLSEYLDIPLATAEELTSPVGYGRPLKEITPKQAAEALKNVLNHRHPRWKAILN